MRKVRASPANDKRYATAGFVANTLNLLAEGPLASIDWLDDL